MKNLLFVFILIVSLLSCSKDEEPNSDVYPQKWQLIKMSGQLPNSTTTGANMEWQEFYLLQANGSFTKSREQDGTVKEASGSYSFKNLEGEKYLQLTYDSDNILIGNCTADLIESLWIHSAGKAVGTWAACDGPGLEYERTK